jgi:hypothetical protein
MKAHADRPLATTFDVVTVVWGARYLQLFLDVCVPNQLTAGNIDALPSGSRYRVFTSPDDVGLLEASRVMCDVSSLMPVDVVPMRELSAASKNRFSRMTFCHRQALMDAHRRQSAVIFLCGDHVLSKGAFAAVVRRHEAGMRAVMCAGLRVHREPIVTALRAWNGAGVEPRELVAQALGHPHPFTVAHIVDSPATALEPISAYWSVTGEGILVRGIHLHPLMVDPLYPEVLPEDTIDGHYVNRACPVRSQVHVVRDSDELVLFETSPLDEALPGTARGGLSRWRTATMMSHSDSHQRWYWGQSIRLHACECSDRWRIAEERSDRFARSVLNLCLWRRWLTPRHLARMFRRDGLIGKPLRNAVRARAKRVRRSASLAAHFLVRSGHQLRKRAVRARRRGLRSARLS